MKTDLEGLSALHSLSPEELTESAGGSRDVPDKAFGEGGTSNG